jgi:hypothetical protein
MGETPQTQAKLIASYTRRFEAVIADEGASTKYRIKVLNTHVIVIFLKTCFCSHYGVLCVY